MKNKFILVLVCLSFLACRKPPHFPPEPVLEFISLDKIDNGTNVDDKAVLKLHFTHGNGNIGLDSTDNDRPPFNDTSSIYYYNFYVIYYAKRSGEFVAFPELGFNARLPRFISANNIPEPIEGEIEYVLSIRNPMPYAPKIDTIKFECWLIDRDFRESNRVITPEIIVVNRQ